MVKSDASWSPGPDDLDWIEAAGRPVHAVLLEIEAVAQSGRIPILDRASGRVLAALAADRHRIVEVGTAIGFSTLWMALAMPADATIVTIDPDRSRTDAARASWRAAGIDDARIRVVEAPALEAFSDGHPELAGPFDMVFIDALKEEYLEYLEALLPRLAAGALIVADNVLWSGRTSGARPALPDDGTDALRRFCLEILRDPRFHGTILPVGDGLLVATYRP